jgi:hypothetical protein
VEGLEEGGDVGVPDSELKRTRRSSKARLVNAARMLTPGAVMLG